MCEGIIITRGWWHAARERTFPSNLTILLPCKAKKPSLLFSFRTIFYSPTNIREHLDTLPKRRSALENALINYLVYDSLFYRTNRNYKGRKFFFFECNLDLSIVISWNEKFLNYYFILINWVQQMIFEIKFR